MSSHDTAGQHPEQHGHHHGHHTEPAGHFDERAATWDEDPAKIERARNTARLLREVLPLTGTERVLDIGGGTGQLGLHLADAVGAVVVSDPSTGMIEVARRNIAAAGLQDRFSALELDLTRDDVPPASFDGACSQLALHHVPDADLLLRRAHEVLRPGGWLAVVDLDADPDGAFHAHVDGFTGHHGFDRDAFADRMRAAGFGTVVLADAGSVEKELDGEDSGRRTFGMFLAVGYA